MPSIRNAHKEAKPTGGKTEFGVGRTSVPESRGAI